MENKTETKKKPKKRWFPPVEKFLTKKEVDLILNATKDQSFVDVARGRKIWRKRLMLIELVFSTGLRVSEICNLKIQHLHLGHGGASIFVAHGKGDKSREVIINKELKQNLTEFVKTKKFVLGEGIEPEDFLFCSAKGEKLSTRALQKGFKACLANAGLSPFLSIHIARHSFASNLYKATHDLRLVQQQLGHSSIHITELYSHLSKEQIQEGMEQLYQE